MNYKYKLIAIDLDGTLLNEKKEITAKNKQSIRKCVDNGIKVVLSSGRAVENITNYIDYLEIKDGYGSAYHGSTIFKAGTNEIVKETFLNSDVAKRIISELINYENIGIIIFTKNCACSFNINKYVDTYNTKKNIEIKLIKSIDEINSDISKILIKAKRETLIDLREKFRHYKDESKIIFSELSLLEFMSLETNKGYSLEQIAKYYNIDLKETIAIGDNYNDMEMIEKAGLGVAVNNAVDDLKNIADYVTINSNEDDAISEVIEKFIFE